MSGMLRKSLETPEEVRPFEAGKGQLALVDMDGVALGRATFEPGWRWSEHVKPIAGTDSCQSAHTGYCLSGRITVRMDDGEEQEFAPGDAMVIAPGHDAWVVGDEACVVLDWQGYADYAKRPA
ncbi:MULTISPECIES: cupin domain-containing protein [unclassified Kitasatospora]|uniref:cupin domain-containing protein n=1 Tax=unclassified Kitasatospora TaxID=2633591 RepID=UPI000710E14F|nr:MULTISPECIES: cupin domain-containing protein [unclassified Kitasatospora]KQV12076.1 cupin [Kitasatospora sp. Root107]KRB72616.1 cupin [Kitasatospora sp. Root187]